MKEFAELNWLKNDKTITIMLADKEKAVVSMDMLHYKPLLLSILEEATDYDRLNTTASRK